MHAILFLLSYTSHITDNNCGLKIVCSVFSDCETFPTNIVVKYSARYKQGTIAEQSSTNCFSFCSIDGPVSEKLVPSIFKEHMICFNKGLL